MKKNRMTDDQVEREIEMLKNSPDVKLYKKYEYARNYRRQYLYALRSMEKKGKELRANGLTEDNLEKMIAEVRANGNCG